MIGWLLLGIIAIGALTFIATNSVGVVALAADTASRVETTRRLDAVKAALESRMGSDASGQMVLPVGIQGGTAEGYNLPAGLPVATRSPWGRPIVYCPFGPVGSAGGTPLTIINADASSYAVTAANGFVVAGRPAYARVAADPELLGFVMMERSRTDGVPSCGSVIFNAGNGRFEAPGAVVRPISRTQGVNELRTVNARELVFYVSPTGSVAASGATMADPTTFETAVAFYRSRLPGAMTIRLLPGNYVVGSDILNMGCGGQAKYGAFLTIEAASPGSGVPTVDMPPGSNFCVPSNITVRSVYFDNDTTVWVMNQSQGDFTEFRAGRLETYGGVVTFAGNVRLTGGVAPAWVTFFVSAGAVVRCAFCNLTLGVLDDRYAMFVMSESSYAQSGGTYTVEDAVPATAARPWLAGQAWQGGRIVFQSTLITVASAGRGFDIGTSSQMVLQTSSMRFLLPLDVAVYMSSSARVSMADSTTIGATGVPPAYAFWDEGGASVTGTGTLTASVACWTGPLFAQSATGTTTGAVSSVLPLVAEPALSAAPSGTEVEAHTRARMTNAARLAMRTINTSGYTCTKV